jgi:FtsP/CotA-like multicopper oxidase with cupredoxin domain
MFVAARRRRGLAMLAALVSGAHCGAPATDGEMPATNAPDATATPSMVDAGAKAGIRDADAEAEAAMPEQPSNWDSDFRIPEATDTNPDPNVVEMSLEARVQNLTMLPSGAEGGPPPQTPMWTYNGGVPGPIIRTKKGNRLIVHFKNSLPEPTTIHWHGVRVPNAMDGTRLAQNAVSPGGTFDYDFVVPDAGTYWYHPHLDSSAQVGFGLYGVLIVEDPKEPFLGDDLVLVLSDVGVNADGSLRPADETGWFGDYFGREGNLELMNGKARSNLTLRMRAGVPQRWRVLDASRSRFQRFTVPNVSLTRVAGDEGLSSAPSPVTMVDLTPGEREEIYAVARAPGITATATQHSVDRFHTGLPFPSAPLFAVEITDDPAWEGGLVLPSSLASIVPIDISNAATREITLDDVLEGAGGAVVDAGRDAVSYLGINGKSPRGACGGLDAGSLDMSAIATAVVEVGDTEIWNVTNNTTQDHPFHIHGYPFQVLSVGGAPPPVLEWRDNVNVPAQGTLKLAVSFSDRPGNWMFHCHILDHADMGMMGLLVVNP